jgi:peptide deformylase
MSSLIKEDNPILRQTAEPVELPLSEEDLGTLKAMAVFVMESQTKEKDDEGNLYVPSVGIAAPQIGISKQMFVVVTSDDDNNLVVMAVVNPKIIKTSKTFITLSNGESCLSVQSVKEGKVPRYEKIRWTGYLVNPETGNFTKKELSPLEGYLSIVFQHEYDHLGGILFKDIMEDRELTDVEKEYLGIPTEQQKEE